MSRLLSWWLAAAGLAAFLAAYQWRTATLESPIWDESMHIASGYSYWTAADFRMNPEHPPFVKLWATIPLLPLGLNDVAKSPRWDKYELVEFGNEFVFNNRSPFGTILGRVRGMMILLTVIGVLLFAWIGRKLVGPAAALCAVALLCTDSNFIAHGKYVTTDVPAAFAVFAAVTAWHFALERPSGSRALAAALALGLALATKFTAVLLLPLLPLYAIFRRTSLLGLLRLTSAVYAGALLVLGLFYWPEIRYLAGSRPVIDPGPPIARGGLTVDRFVENQDPVSNAIKTYGQKWKIPALAYLIGAVNVHNHNVAGHVSYLNGVNADRATKSYFPVAFLVKTPLALLAGLVLGLAFVRSGPLLLLTLPPAYLFALAVAGNINIGHRHILPVYPFLILLAGAAIASLFRAGKIGRAASALVIAGAFVECLSVYPHATSFFNRASGGPETGWRYLLDSNLDWGQDLPKAAAFLKRNGYDYACLKFFGPYDPRAYGVDAHYLPATGQTQEMSEMDCVGVVNLTSLFGPYLPPKELEWLRGRKPLASIGYSMWVFDLRKNRARPLDLTGTQPLSPTAHLRTTSLR